MSGTGLEPVDIARHREFHARMVRFARVLAFAAEHTPPHLTGGTWRDSFLLARLGIRLRMLGRTEMRELLRIGAINLHDVLEEEFEDEALKGALALDGVLGSFLGPRSPNTVLGFLYRRLAEVWGGRCAVPMGGMGAITRALASAAAAAGASMRTGARVTGLLMAGARANGVRLADGEEIRADVVASSADPHTTFADIVGYPGLDTGFVRRIDNHRARGTTAKLHLALSGLPRFTGVADADHGARLVIAPSLRAVERAFDAAKYGDWSPEPVLEINLPTVHDPDLAPQGHHVLSAIVQYAPPDPREPWAQIRGAFIHAVLDRIEAHAPGLKNLVTAAELVTPEDVETRFGIRGGHWHHGELGFDQFMMTRPVPGAAHYATPVDGLYLCGAGAHPGGGVMGLAGRNAAAEIRRREARR